MTIRYDPNFTPSWQTPSIGQPPGPGQGGMNPHPGPRRPMPRPGLPNPNPGEVRQKTCNRRRKGRRWWL